MSAQPQTMSTRASIMLAREQHTGIDVHGARENGVRLILGWATLMLTFTAADQVHTLLAACTDARPGAGRPPVEVNPAILSTNIGDEAYVPAIAVTYRDIPRCITTVHTSGPGVLGDGRTSAGSCTSPPGCCCSGSSTGAPTPAR